MEDRDHLEETWKIRLGNVFSSFFNIFLFLSKNLVSFSGNVLVQVTFLLPFSSSPLYLSVTIIRVIDTGQVPLFFGAKAASVNTVVAGGTEGDRCTLSRAFIVGTFGGRRDQLFGRRAKLSYG